MGRKKLERSIGSPRSKLSRTSLCVPVLPLGVIIASRCHLLTCLLVVLQATTFFAFSWIGAPQGIVTSAGSSHPIVAFCLAEVVAKSGPQTHLLGELQPNGDSADGSDAASKRTHTDPPRSVPDTEFLFEGGTPATHTSSAPNTKKLRRDDRRTTSAFGAGSDAVQNVASNKEETRKSATASRVDVDLGYDGSDTAFASSIAYHQNHLAAKPQGRAAAPVEASLKMLRRTRGEHEEAAAAAHDKKAGNQKGAGEGQEEAIEMMSSATKEQKASAPDDVAAAAAQQGANENSTHNDLDATSLVPPSSEVLTSTPPAVLSSSTTTSTQGWTMLRRQQREESRPDGAAVEVAEHQQDSDSELEVGARAPSAPAPQRMTTSQQRAKERRSEVQVPSSSPPPEVVEALLFLDNESSTSYTYATKQEDVDVVQGEGEESEKALPGDHERAKKNHTTTTSPAAITRKSV